MSEIRVDNITDEAGTGKPGFSNGVQTSNINGGQVGGRRNLIINGAMQVAQRGTSGFTNDTDYTLDRWWMIGDQVSQSTEAPDGFSHSLKLEVLSSGAIGQPIELPKAGSASPFVLSNKVTLSFYIRTDSGVGEVKSIIKFRDSKFSGSNESIFGPTLTTATDQNWNRVIHTFTVPAINNTNEIAGLEIYGVTETSYITGVQLEVGDTATEFEHRSFGEELALCQRYFERIGEDGSNTYFASIPVEGFIDNQYINLKYVVKRVAPTFTFPTTGDGQPGGDSLNCTIKSAQLSYALVETNSPNQSYLGQTTNFAGVFAELDAEL